MELGCIRVIETEARPDIHITVQKVLNQFQKIFDSPIGLPPRWSHDHAITLLPRTPPINLRPYKIQQIYFSNSLAMKLSPANPADLPDW